MNFNIKLIGEKFYQSDIRVEYNLKMFKNWMIKVNYIHKG